MRVPALWKHLVALTALSAVSAVDALGQAIVVNQCSFPAYLWSVSNTQGPMQTLNPNGGTYSAGFQTNPAGGGISIKIGRSPSLADPVIQFEYTYLGLLWYDLSLVNGSPFMNKGITVIPSDSSCNSVMCEAGGRCGTGSVFYEPDDTSAIEACQANTNIVVTLCSGNHGGSGRRGHRKNRHHGGGAPHPARMSAPPPAMTSMPFSPPAPAVSTQLPALNPSPASTAAPPPTSPPCSTSQMGGYTTFITEYTTVDTTTDQVVTVTARKA